MDDEARKLPLSVMVQLMRKGSGGLMDFSKKYVSFWQNALTLAEEKIDKVDTLIGRENGSEEKEEDAPSDADEGSQEEFLRLLDDRILRIMEKRDAELESQFTSLKDDITKLTMRIEMFENMFYRMVKFDEKQLPKTNKDVNGDG